VWTILLLLLITQESLLPVVRMNDRATGALSASDPPLKELPGHNLKLHGRQFRLDVSSPGQYTIEHRSYFYNPYLILLDGQGNVLGADADSGPEFHATISFRLTEGFEYPPIVQVGTTEGASGPFDLLLYEGGPRYPEDTDESWIYEGRKRAEIVEKHLGPADPRTVHANRLLANHLNRAEREQEAIKTVEGLLGRIRTTQGAHHEGALRVLATLVSMLEAGGDLQASERCLREHLEEVIGDPRIDGRLEACRRLATHLVVDGRNRLALQVVRRALALAVASGVDDDATDARVELKCLLSHLLAEAGRTEKATRAIEEALAECATASAIDPSLRARVTLQEARMLERRGLPFEALNAVDRAIETLERSRGADHPETLMAMRHRGWVLLLLGRYDDARLLLEQVVAELATRRRGAEQALARRTLGDVLLRQGSISEAHEEFSTALGTLAEIFGRHHPRVAEVKQALANVAIARGEYELARRLLSDAIRIFLDTNVQGTPFSALAEATMAKAARLQGHINEARILYAGYSQYSGGMLGAEASGGIRSEDQLFGVSGGSRRD